MPAHNGNGPLNHFGNQVRKERLARGWSLRELSARTGLALGYLSQIETGRRAPTVKVANAIDEVFQERNGWFREWLEDNKSSIPPGLRSWAEHEDHAVRLHVWSPGIIDGLLQTADYARALLQTYPDVTAEQIDARLVNRKARQQRVLFREDPPNAWFVVDEVALYRFVGSAEIMAVQMTHLLEVAGLPNVTMQVLPVVAHPANASDIIIADNNAAYAESLAGGGTYTGTETFTRLERLMTTILGETYRTSESTARIQRMQATWKRLGVSPPIQTPTAGRASKRPRAKDRS
jgi:transcriptional regulator with XRE-family HTH domain